MELFSPNSGVPMYFVSKTSEYTTSAWVCNNCSAWQPALCFPKSGLDCIPWHSAIFRKYWWGSFPQLGWVSMAGQCATWKQSTWIEPHPKRHKCKSRRHRHPKPPPAQRRGHSCGLSRLFILDHQPPWFRTLPVLTVGSGIVGCHCTRAPACENEGFVGYTQLSNVYSSIDCFLLG